MAVDLQDWYAWVETVLSRISTLDHGGIASRPAVPGAGDCFLATDTQRFYICYVGGIWTDVTLAYLLLAGGAMTGDIAMGGNKVTGLGAPALANDAVRKAYADLFTLLATFNNHSARHENGGADEISVAGLSGLLADDQHVLDAEVLLVAAALVHAARHENGGADEISVLGLSGLLADDQHVLDAEVVAVALALTGGTMAGDIQMGANKLKTTNMLFKEQAATIMALKNAADNAYRTLRIGALQVGSNIGFQADDIGVRGNNTDDHFWTLDCRDNGVALIEVARCQGADDPYFQVTLPMRLLPAGVPGVVLEGHFWYDAAADKVLYRDAGATRTLAREGHGAPEHTDVARTKHIPATSGFVFAGAENNYQFYGAASGAFDSDEPEIFFTFEVPDDFVSFTSVQVVWVCPAAGVANMYWRLQAHYAAAGEGYLTHTDTPAIGATATGGANIMNVQEPANPLTLASLAKGDKVGFYFLREGSNVLDTLDQPTFILELLFNYTAEQ